MYVLFMSHKQNILFLRQYIHTHELDGVLFFSFAPNENPLPFKKFRERKASTKYEKLLLCDMRWWRCRESVQCGVSQVCVSFSSDTKRANERAYARAYSTSTYSHIAILLHCVLVSYFPSSCSCSWFVVAYFALVPHIEVAHAFHEAQKSKT